MSPESPMTRAGVGVMSCPDISREATVEVANKKGQYLNHLKYQM